MLSVPGHHLGDTWYFVDRDRAHCFLLVCPAGTPRHTAWDIGHASSRDLKHWTYEGIILRRGCADTWDGLCLATGSVLSRDGRYWMAYTGNWCGPRPAVGLAVSDNLRDWEKVAGNPITTIDERYYTGASRGQRAFPHWRDPFLLEVDGVVYHLVCATAANQKGSAGTIGVARSSDLHIWELLPALDIDPFTEELECPQVVSAHGRYFLIFSTHSDLLLAKPALQSGGNMYAMVGDAPLGPYRILSREPLLPTSMRDRPYAGRIVWFDGRPYLLGTVWRDAGDLICDPIPVEFTATGIKALGHPYQLSVGSQGLTRSCR
jgi:beta-fructofuranosidase